MTPNSWDEALSGVASDPEHATALGRECYVDPAFFELEVERIMSPADTPSRAATS